MVSKISLQNDKEISISFDRASFLRLINALGMISGEAKKSANISWRQYKKGESHLLKDAQELLS